MPALEATLLAYVKHITTAIPVLANDAFSKDEIAAAEGSFRMQHRRW